MRVGYNPHKDLEQEQTEYLHQVIIPVFIPHEEGYYKDAFKILQNCIGTLLSTIHDKTFVSIINNGSCEKVTGYLSELFHQNKIHELIHTNNIGKLNAILKGLSGNAIELVTIADSDVLFCPNWQSESIKVFNAFPKTGVVGIVPQFKMFESYSSNVIFDHFFSLKLAFTEVMDPNALVKFYESIGWDYNYNKDYLKRNLSLTSKDCVALVGSGHFVATYRKTLFDEIVTYIGFKMGSNSEGYLDRAPLKKGYWRLTTSRNFAYHMGNVWEAWMEEEVLKASHEKLPVEKLISDNPVPNKTKLLLFVKNKLFAKLFSNKRFRRLFYSMKRLPKEMITKY